MLNTFVLSIALPWSPQIGPLVERKNVMLINPKEAQEAITN